MKDTLSVRLALRLKHLRNTTVRKTLPLHTSTAANLERPALPEEVFKVRETTKFAKKNLMQNINHKKEANARNCKGRKDTTR